MMKRFLTAAAALLVFAAAQAEEPGRICLLGDPASADSDRACVPAHGRDSVTLAPAEEPRPYIWTSQPVREIRLGTVPSRATRISMFSEGDRTIPLRIHADAGEWPQEIAITVSADERMSWRWTLSSHAAETLRSLRLPKGRYSLVLSAPRFQDISRTITEDDGDNGENLYLRRLPRIMGEIVDARSREPVSNASVSTDGAENVLTSSDGAFALDITGQWPAYLRIETPRHGRSLLAVPRRQGDIDLGPVPVRAAGELRITLDIARQIGADVYSLADAEPLLLTRREPGEAVKDLRIEDLAPGTYQILLRGPLPLQRRSIEVTIHEGELTHEYIALEPVAVTVRLLRGDEPLSGGRLRVRYLDEPSWSTDLTLTDAHIETEIWQTGAYGAFVTIEGEGGPFYSTTELKNTHAEWVIELTGVRVGGRVTAENGIPLERVMIDLTSDRGRKRTFTSENGTFLFSFTQPGTYEIHARAEGYLDASQSVEINPDGSDRELQMVLSQPVTKILHVVNAHGTPLAGAAVVYEGDNLPFYTDHAGNVRLALRKDEQRTIFVIPREGSFAIARVSARDKIETTRVIVPDGDAMIGIRAVTTTGVASPNISLLARYNGHLLPLIAVEMFGRQQGAYLRTAAYGVTKLERMPSGVYEFWPIFSAAEREQLNSTPAPVRVAVQPGPNWVTLTFSKKNTAAD